MKEELSQNWEKRNEKDAGEGSLECSERSERNGSEPSPATRSREGAPEVEIVPEESSPPQEDSSAAGPPPLAEPSEEDPCVVSIMSRNLA